MYHAISEAGRILRNEANRRKYNRNRGTYGSYTEEHQRESTYRRTGDSGIFGGRRSKTKRKKNRRVRNIKKKYKTFKKNKGGSRNKTKRRKSKSRRKSRRKSSSIKK